MSKKHDLSYVTVRRWLLEYMDSGNDSNRWLPSERELGEKLGVSRDTVRKAISMLVDEKRIFKFPRKGSYMSIIPPSWRVGIIHGDAKPACDIGYTTFFSTILSELGKAGCKPRIITLGKYPEKDISKYDLDGILFLLGSPFYPLMKKIIKEKKMAIMNCSIFNTDLENMPSSNIVFRDINDIRKLRAEYFLSKGITRLGYVGTENETFKSFKRILKEAGINFPSDCIIEDAADIPERLPEIIKKHDIRGIVSDGALQRIETLFHTIRKNGFAKKVEILPDLIPQLHELLNYYSDINVKSVNAISGVDTGKAVVEALVKQLKSRIYKHPKITMKSKLYSIEEVRNIRY
jgi:hypothetical protein